MKRGFVLTYCAFVGALVACTEKSPSGPDGLAPVIVPSGMVVSNPGPSSQTSTGNNFAGSITAASSTVAYVSAQPGTFPDVKSARLRNQTRGGAAVTVNVNNGGFDPVEIAAEVDDELSLELMTGSSSTIVSIKVPPRRPPRVVRTSPSTGRIDVALNVHILVVFSEPVDKSTVSPSTLSLSQGATTVAGSVTVAADGLSVEFVPAEDLKPGATYELATSEAIRDLSGDALDKSSTVTFTTAQPVVFDLSVFTTGWDLDPDGYHLIVDGDDYGAVSSNGNITLSITDGRHEFNLTGIAENCAISGVPSPYASASSGGRSFTIQCLGTAKAAGELAFVSDRDGNAEIYRMRADGSDPVRLTNNPTIDRNPRWSPDGNSIAFVRETEKDVFELFIMKADGSQVRQLTTTGGVWDPAWSPDGKKLVYTYSANKTEKYGDLAILDVQEGESTRTYLGLTALNAGSPTWMPDGSRITFVSWGGLAPGSDIMTVKPDGSSPVVLVDGKTPFDYNDFPSWSPDGRRMAFYVCRSDCDGYAGIRVLDAATRSIVAGIGSGTDLGYDGYAPRWSADGSVISYEMYTIGPLSQTNLYYVKPDGSYRGILALRARDASWRSAAP